MCESEGRCSPPAERISDQRCALDLHLFVEAVQEVYQRADTIADEWFVRATKSYLVWCNHTVLLCQWPHRLCPVRPFSAKSMQQDDNRAAARLDIMYFCSEDCNEFIISTSSPLHEPSRICSIG